MSTLAFIVYNTYTISIGPFNFIITIPSPVCNMSVKGNKKDSRPVARASKGSLFALARLLDVT